MIENKTAKGNGSTGDDGRTGVTDSVVDRKRGPTTTHAEKAPQFRVFRGHSVVKGNPDALGWERKAHTECLQIGLLEHPALIQRLQTWALRQRSQLADLRRRTDTTGEMLELHIRAHPLNVHTDRAPDGESEKGKLVRPGNAEIQACRPVGFGEGRFAEAVVDELKPGGWKIQVVTEEPTQNGAGRGESKAIGWLQKPLCLCDLARSQNLFPIGPVLPDFIEPDQPDMCLRARQEVYRPVVSIISGHAL